MEFTVFTDAALAPCFVLDSEVVNAVWVHEELRLELTVIDDPAKVMTRGQRILFTDPRGEMQLFEVRKVDHTEPDAAQIVTAEHIALAELSDDHIAPKEFTNTSASAALSSVLDGTLWSVGTVSVTGTSSVDTAMGNVWEACNTIAEAWNGRIVPRITFGASGVTGRYIDLLAAGGTWRGITLEVAKNLVGVGVTIDDTDLYTALYGYGRATDGNPLTFSGVTWTTAGGNPANKPAGQTYIEDTAATAAFGRNGRPRFGYYQNGDITDPSILLQKTWETLQAVKTLRISIESTVADLHRLGYADQPLRLYDIAKVIYTDRANVVEQQGEIIRMQEDLLDPTATQLTIGTYIPNIIYIQRENARKTYGRGGGGGHGQTPQEATFQEFYTQISANEYQIDLVARQVTQVETDVGVTEEILRQAGLSINAEGVLVYADDNVNMWQSKLNVQADRITSEVTRATEAEGSLSSRITQTADAITAEVSRATAAEGQLSSRITVTAEAVESKVSAGDIASTINQTAQSVLIEASKINLVGYVTASELSATNARITNLTSGVTQAALLNMINGTVSNNLSVGGTLTVDSTAVHPRSIVMTGITVGATFFGGTTDALDLSHYHVLTIEEGTGTSAGQITVTIGTTSGTASDGVANFNIAATQTYRNGVAAADTAGYNRAWGVAASSTYSQLPTGSGDSFTAKVPSATVNTATTRTYRLSAGSWDGNACAVTLRNTFNNAPVCALTVDASSIFEAGWLRAAASSSIDGGASAGWLSVTIPRKNGYEHYDTVYYDVSGDTTLDASGRAYARLKNRASGGTVAYADITGLYSAGYTAGQNAGYASGWNAAAGAVDRIENNTAKTIVFRYPSTYPDSGQSVYYLDARVADSGSVSSYTNKRYSVGLGTTYKYLYFTATIGGVSRVVGVQIRIDASNVTPG